MSISVLWDAPPFLDQNGVITGYQVTITNVNRTNVSTVVNVIGTSHMALNLQEFEAYDIEVAAMTAVGLGPFSDAVRNQTLEDSKCIILATKFFLSFIILSTFNKFLCKN